MTARLFDYDPLTGERQYWIYNEADDTVTIRHVQDVSGIIEENQALYNMTDENERWGEFTRVAHIPNVILEQWIREGVLASNGHGGWSFKNDMAALKRLDSNEWTKLRTRPGSLSR